MSKKLLLILLFGLLIRLFLMPLALQADLLSMSYRAHLMSEYGLWGLSSNQSFGHYIYAFNLQLLRPFFDDVSQFFSTSHGMSPTSTTSSVGDWLNFVEHPHINAFIFALKIPHLLADLAIFALLAGFFARHKRRLTVLALWWFNPVNLYAFYVFARHDSLTILAVMAAVLLLAKSRLLASLLALFAAVQLRFQPILYLPLFLVHLWRNFSLRRLFWPLLLAAILVLAILQVQKGLPFDQARYAQIKGIEVLAAPSPSAPALSLTGRLLEVLEKPFVLATSVGGKSTLGSLLAFSLVYVALLGFYFLLRQQLHSEQAFLQLNLALYLTLAFYFLLNDFSPHYFVWLSGFASVGVLLGRSFLAAYLLAILGWAIMGLVDAGNFAINQNLFLPISPLLFNTPQLAYVLPYAATLSLVGQTLFSLGLLWSIFLCLRHFWPNLHNSKQLLRLLKPGATFVLLFALTLFFAKPALAAKIPVAEQSSENKVLLELNQPYIATFTASVAEFGALDLKFDTSRSQAPRLIAFRLKFADSSSWLYENTYQAADFYNRSFYPFGFPVVTDALGRELIYEVELLEATDLPLYIYADTYVISQEASLRELLPMLKVELADKWQAQRGFWLFWLGLLGLNLAALLGVILWREKRA